MYTRLPSTTGDDVICAAGCVSTWVFHFRAPVFRSTARTKPDGWLPTHTPGVTPKITLSAVTAGVSRALIAAGTSGTPPSGVKFNGGAPASSVSPARAATDFDHTARPVFASMR